MFSNEFDIRESVNDVVDLEITSANLKHVELFAKIAEDIPEKLIGDDHRLQKILLNLVGNAVKFTLEGHVKVDVSVHKKESNKIYLSIIVEDTGIGIPEDKFDFIFERFARIDEANKELFEGTGLGLNVVKQFVEEMKGTISVESVLKKGTKFTCILPFEISAGKELTTEEIDYDIEALTKCLNENPPSKVLIVEDNRMAQVATKRTLEENLKSKVDTASAGKEALELAKKNKYDLIFMDIGLPDTNGYKVTEEIRKMEEGRDVKTSIVALTAHEPAEEANKSIASGMNDFLTKPLTVEKGLVALFKWVFQKKNPKLNVKNIIVEKKETTTKTSAIDWQLSIDLMNGNADAAKEMLELFVKETLPVDEKEIAEAFEKKDLSELVKTTHKMHGGLCYVGVPILKEACKNLEVAAKLGEKEKIDDLYSDLKEQIEEVKKNYKENF